MEIVIKISEEDYKSIKDDVKKFLSMPGHKVPVLYKAVDEGILLPKGHGKIVDIGKIDEDRIDDNNPVVLININGDYMELVSLDYINDLPALVEEDKDD